jgi:hypothetical protein
VVKTVESALQVNIFKICKAVRQTRSMLVKVEWVFGCASHTGVALLANDVLALMVGDRVLQAPVSRREFRNDRFQPHIQCLACGKQCHVLYVEGESLQCRRCAGLIYECQRGHAPDRAYLKAKKIIARLGGQPGQAVPPRPAGMWRNTYYRQILQLAEAQRSAFGALLSGHANSG